jgi:hypothetical protein
VQIVDLLVCKFQIFCCAYSRMIISCWPVTYIFPCLENSSSGFLVHKFRWFKSPDWFKSLTWTNSLQSPDCLDVWFCFSRNRTAYWALQLCVLCFLLWLLKSAAFIPACISQACLSALICGSFYPRPSAQSASSAFYFNELANNLRSILRSSRRLPRRFMELDIFKVYGSNNLFTIQTAPRNDGDLVSKKSIHQSKVPKGDGIEEPCF